MGLAFTRMGNCFNLDLPLRRWVLRGEGILPCQLLLFGLFVYRFGPSGFFSVSND